MPWSCTNLLDEGNSVAFQLTHLLNKLLVIPEIGDSGLVIDDGESTALSGIYSNDLHFFTSFSSLAIS